MTETAIDRAHSAMTAAPDDDVARLSFFERIADNELFLLLDAPPVGDNVTPALFDTQEGRFALVFDREWRLTEFTGTSSPFAALSGRTVASLLAQHGIGLGVNLDVAPSSILMPPEAVAWLAQTLSGELEETSGHPEQLMPPQGLPEKLLTSLDTKLSGAAGLADTAYLNLVVWAGGRRGHLLSFIAPLPGAQSALAKAVSEALIFSGIDAGELDVSFFERSDPIAERLAATGLQFDLPKIDAARSPSSPGMDPGRPPKLV